MWAMQKKREKEEDTNNEEFVKEKKLKTKKANGETKEKTLFNLRGIASKIMLIFAVAVILLVACMIYMGVRAHQFNEQNTHALENMSKINYIKEELESDYLSYHYMIVDGKPKTVRVSARAMKTLKAGAKANTA